MKQIKNLNNSFKFASTHSNQKPSFHQTEIETLQKVSIKIISLFHFHDRSDHRIHRTIRMLIAGHIANAVRPPAARIWRTISLGKKEYNYMPLPPIDDPSSENLIPVDLSKGRNLTNVVPRGFVAVYVGTEMKRYVIPTIYLSLPDFRALMERTAEEFGFEQEGGLKFPCDEEHFDEVLGKCSERQKRKKKDTSSDRSYIGQSNAS